MVTFGDLIEVLDITGYNYYRRGGNPIITDEHGNEITEQDSKAICHLKLGPKYPHLGNPGLFLATRNIPDKFITRQITLESLKDWPFPGLAGLLISTDEADINKLNLRQFEQIDPVLFRQAEIIADKNSSAYRTQINISFGHEDLLKQPGRFYVSFMHDELDSRKIRNAIGGIAETYRNFKTLIDYSARSGLRQAGLLVKEEKKE